MIDIEKLKYDLALQSAVVMTLRGYEKNPMGNPPDMMLTNFLLAYRRMTKKLVSKN